MCFNIYAWNMVSVNQLYLFILLLCIYKYIIYIYLQNYQDPLEAVLGKPLMTCHGYLSN